MKLSLRCLTTVLAAMIIVGVASAGYAFRANGSGIRSSAELVITGNSSPTLDNAYTASQYVTSRMATYAAVATSETVLKPASSSLGVAEDGLIGSVTATVVQNTTVLDLSVSGRTPADAQRRAKAVTVALSGAITDLESGTISPSSAVAVNVLSSASKPPASDLPSPLNAGLIGAGVGLVLGLFLCLVLRTLVFRPRAWPVQPIRAQEPAEPATGSEVPEDKPRRSDGKSSATVTDRTYGSRATSGEAAASGATQEISTN